MPKTKTEFSIPETEGPWLLDVNFLLALCWEECENHQVAHHWFLQRNSVPWATCELTESAFLRLSMNPKLFPEPASFLEALDVLETLRTLEGHRFLPSIQPSSKALLGSLRVRGYRQINDALLLSIARQHQGQLVTFDRGIATLATPPDWKMHLLTLPPFA